MRLIRTAMIVLLSITLFSTIACTAETKYSLNVDVYSGQGIVTPSYGTYTEGTAVTIAAIPDSGWEFDRWDGDTSGDENPTTVRISRDKIIRAYFVEIQVPTPTPTTIPTPTPISTPTPTSPSEPTPTPTPVSTPTTIPTPTPTYTSTKLITVTYSSTTASQIGTGSWPDEPDAGYVYLILDMTIQNQGYSSFSVGSFYFSVVVNQIVYDSAFVMYLDNELNYVDILNGGSVTGKLAFEVPIGTTAFTMQYEGFGSYNIQWIPQ